jgi:outer membrane protein assembly factor BamB
LGWQTYLPTDGRRDSIFSIQNAGDLLLVQTRSGVVLALDPETGQARWQVRVGRPYRVSVRLGYNSKAVYVVNDQTLYVLDRASGDLLWDFDMPSAATAAPVADEDQVFLSLKGGTLSAFSIPRINPDLASRRGGSAKELEKAMEKPADKKQGGSGVGKTSSIGALSSPTGEGTRVLAAVGPLSTARQASHSATSGIEPRLDWSDASGLRLELTPLQTGDTVFLTGGHGKIAALDKGLARSERYVQTLADDSITVQPGQYQEKAYVAAQDANLYCVFMPSGKVEWRFTSGTPITRKPAVTDQDVFVTADRGGLHRLDQQTGREIWRNRGADQFLAVNPKCVYATDPSGRLLLLDRAHGTQIGSLETRDFVVPFANELTDRVYLAANDGLMICLHDRDYAKPLRNKKVVEMKRPAKSKLGDSSKPKPEDTPKPKAKPPEDKEPPAPEPDKGADMEKKP